MVTEEEVALLLINIPRKIEARYGQAHASENQIMSEIIELKQQDTDEISQFSKALFSHFVDGNIYFDEYVRITKEITSELHVSVYDCFYKCVPCIKNFLLLRSNYIQVLNDQFNIKLHQSKLTLSPPVTSKMREKFVNIVEKEEKQEG